MPAPEQVYSPQIGAGGTAPFGGSTPDAFGAGVGAAIEQAGHQLGAAASQAHAIALQRQYENDLADASKQASQFRLAARQQAIGMEQQPAPGGAGHAEGFKAWYDAGKQNLLEGIVNPRVREHVAGQLDDDQVGMQARAETFEAAQRGAQWAQNIDDHATVSGNVVRLDPSRETLTREIGSIDDAIEKGPGSDEDKRKYAAQVRAQLSRSYISALPPQKAKEELASGYFSSWLNARTSEQLGDQADTEIRRQQVDARQAIALRRKDAETFLTSVQQRVDNHIPVPAADFERAASLVGDKDLKLEAQGFDIGKAQVTDKVNRVYAGATPQTIAARVDLLNAEITNKGDKVDPTHVIERNVLQSMLPQRREEQNQDPLALYARSGGHVTPIDWSDPMSIQAREGQWRQARGQLGPLTGPLLRDEASQIEQELARGNTAARVEVANRLVLGGPEFAVAAARQVAPGDQHLQTAVALAAMGPQGRATARDSLLGSDALAAHRGIVRESAARQEFDRISGEAFAGLTPDAQHGLYDTAMGLYATRMTRAGKTAEWPQMGDQAQRGEFWTAVSLAAGATKRPNGEFQGGVGRHAGVLTLMPSNMTQTELEARIGRATPADFAAAAGGATPVYANGRPPTAREFKTLRIEAVGDGVYRVKLGNAFLGRAGGAGLYEFDANKLPARH